MENHLAPPVLAARRAHSPHLASTDWFSDYSRAAGERAVHKEGRTDAAVEARTSCQMSFRSERD